MRWGLPQILSLHGCVVSVAAPWRGHPRAPSPESTISVHHGYTQLHLQVNRGHQGITGGWFERKGRREYAQCRLGWTPSLFSSWANVSMLRRPCLGPCATFPGLTITSPKSRAFLQDAIDACTTPVLPDSPTNESAVLAALREADYALICLDKCKVGLQLWRNGCCLLHRQHLFPLI